MEQDFIWWAKWNCNKCRFWPAGREFASELKAVQQRRAVCVPVVRFATSGWCCVTYLHQEWELCQKATSLELATLVCWFRGSFRAPLCFLQSQFFQMEGWWLCLPLRGAALHSPPADRGQTKPNSEHFLLPTLDWQECICFLWLSSTTACWWRWEYCAPVLSYRPVSITPADTRALGTRGVVFLPL